MSGMRPATTMGMTKRRFSRCLGENQNHPATARAAMMQAHPAVSRLRLAKRMSSPVTETRPQLGRSMTPSRLQ